MEASTEGVRASDDGEQSSEQAWKSNEVYGAMSKQFQSKFSNVQ